MVNGGCKLDNVPIKQFGLFMSYQSNRPLIPQTRDITLEILGRSGLMDFGAELGERTFLLEFVVEKKDYIELQQFASEFANFLTDHNGKPRTMRLVFDAQTDRYYNVRYSGNLDFTRMFRAGIVKLPLTAFDPFSYADETVIEEYITEGSHNMSIQSNGTVVTPSVIELTNLGSNTINGFTIEIEFMTEV